MKVWIAVAALFVVTIFVVAINYSSNEDFENVRVIKGPEDTEPLDAKTIVMQKDNAKGQISAQTSNADNQVTIVISDAETDIAQQKCKQELKQFREAQIEKIIQNTLPDERLPLFVLTGWQDLVSDRFENLPDGASIAEETKKLQLELLREASENGDSSLYTQLYIEECATNDIAEFCSNEDLQNAASKHADNVSVWLSLINFYRNQGMFDEIEQTVRNAAQSIRLDNYQSEYYKEVYSNALTLSDSPKFSAFLMLNYTSRRLYGLGALKKYCEQNGNEECFQVGEVLEKYSSRNEARTAGIELQLDYYRKSLQLNEFSERESELNELKEEFNEYFGDLRIPFTDDMAYILSENLNIEDELEYFAKIREEAKAVIANSPDVCTW